MIVIDFEDFELKIVVGIGLSKRGTSVTFSDYDTYYVVYVPWIPRPMHMIHCFGDRILCYSSLPRLYMGMT